MAFTGMIYQQIEKLLSQKFTHAWEALPNKADFKNKHLSVLEKILERDGFRLMISQMKNPDDLHCCANFIASEIVDECDKFEDLSITNIQIQDGFAKFKEGSVSSTNSNSSNQSSVPSTLSAHPATNSATVAMSHLRSYPHETGILSHLTVGANTQITVGNVSHTQHIYVGSASTTTQDRDLTEQIHKHIKELYRSWTIKTPSGNEFSLDTNYINLQLLCQAKLKAKPSSEGNLQQDQDNEESTNTPDARISSYETLFSDKRVLALTDLFKPTSELPFAKELETTEQMKPNFILVQGSAGVGKTTFIRCLSQAWTRDDNKRIFTEFAWVFTLTLRELDEEKFQNNQPKALWQWVYYALTISTSSITEDEFRVWWIKAIEPIITQGKVLFLLDGLDELPPKHDCKDAFHALIHGPYRLATKIITSRPYGVINIPPHRRDVEIIGFSNENIRTYINMYFPGGATATRALILKQLRAHPTLWSSAHIPITLSIICGLCASALNDKRTINLENFQTMTSLYKALTDNLIKRIYLKSCDEQKAADFTDLTGDEEDYPLKKYNTALLFLEELAFAGMQQKSVILSAALVDKIRNQLHLSLDDFKLAKTLGFAKPLSADNKAWEFLHLTFQEFFAARRVCNHLCSEDFNLRKNAETFLLKQKYNSQLQIMWWFVAGLLKDNESVLNHFFDILEQEPRDLTELYHILLSIRCLDESELKLEHNRADKIISELLPWIKRDYSHNRSMEKYYLREALIDRDVREMSIGDIDKMTTDKLSKKIQQTLNVCGNIFQNEKLIMSIYNYMAENFAKPMVRVSLTEVLPPGFWALTEKNENCIKISRTVRGHSVSLFFTRRRVKLANVATDWSRCFHEPLPTIRDNDLQVKIVRYLNAVLKGGNTEGLKICEEKLESNTQNKIRCELASKIIKKQCLSVKDTIDWIAYEAFPPELWPVLNIVSPFSLEIFNQLAIMITDINDELGLRAHSALRLLSPLPFEILPQLGTNISHIKQVIYVFDILFLQPQLPRDLFQKLKKKIVDHFNMPFLEFILPQLEEISDSDMTKWISVPIEFLKEVVDFITPLSRINISYDTWPARKNACRILKALSTLPLEILNGLTIIAKLDRPYIDDIFEILAKNRYLNNENVSKIGLKPSILSFLLHESIVNHMPVYLAKDEDALYIGDIGRISLTNSKKLEEIERMVKQTYIELMWWECYYDENGQTELIVAAKKGDVNSVSQLLAARANPALSRVSKNADDFDNGFTPLHYACTYGHTQIVELLLKFNTPVDILCKKKWSPLYMAICNKNVTAVKIICRHQKYDSKLTQNILNITRHKISATSKNLTHLISYYETHIAIAYSEKDQCDYYHNLACTYHAMKYIPQADDCFEKIFELNNEPHQGIRCEYANFLLHSCRTPQNVAKAKRLLIEVIQASDDDSELSFSTWECGNLDEILSREVSFYKTISMHPKIFAYWLLITQIIAYEDIDISEHASKTQALYSDFPRLPDIPIKPIVTGILSLMLGENEKAIYYFNLVTNPSPLITHYLELARSRLQSFQNMSALDIRPKSEALSFCKLAKYNRFVLGEPAVPNILCAYYPDAEPRDIANIVSAIRTNDLSQFKKLTPKIYDIDICVDEDTGSTLLHLVVKHNFTTMLVEVLSRNPNLNIIDDNKLTVFNHVIEKLTSHDNNAKLMAKQVQDLLLTHLIQTYAVTDKNQALCVAAAKGNAEALEFLLYCAADPHSLSTDSKLTPSTLAKINGHTKCEKILIKWFGQNNTRPVINTASSTLTSNLNLAPTTVDSDEQKIAVIQNRRT